MMIKEQKNGRLKSVQLKMFKIKNSGFSSQVHKSNQHLT